MTIGLSPTFEIGPVSVAWHGLFTAAGLLVAFLAAERFARARGLDPSVASVMTLVAGAAGLVGARLFYLAQEDPGRLLTPWSGGSTGFAFYGSLILGIPAVALALRLSGRPVLPSLDVAALAFPFGMAIGRIGDLLNGEHYGAPTSLPWGVTYTDPTSHAPRVDDVGVVDLGLRQAQWTSLALLVAALIGFALVRVGVSDRAEPTVHETARP